MAGVRKRGTKWELNYYDSNGRQYFKTIPAAGVPKKDAKMFAEQMESQQRRSDLGLDDGAVRERMKVLPMSDVITEYLAWGNNRGGHGGQPWSATHAMLKEKHLRWWTEVLKLHVVADLELQKGPVNGQLVALTAEKRSTKTQRNMLGALTSFCQWLVDHDYLPSHPLQGIRKPSAAVQRHRRPLTAEEVLHFLEHCDPTRRLTYEVAIYTGLRANELRQLTHAHLDVARSGLRLDREWTKNRKEGFQPLPLPLTQALDAAGKRKDATRLYAKFLRNLPEEACTPRMPSGTPLLYLSSSPIQGFNRDLVKAGIPKVTDEGTLDFHSLRATYATLMMDFGNAKEVQTLMRHSTVSLTMDRYVKTSQSRLSEKVQSMYDSMQENRPRQQQNERRVEQERTSPLRLVSELVSETRFELVGQSSAS